MSTTEEDIFNTYAALMTEAVALFEERMERIKPEAGSSQDSIEGAAISVFKNKSIEVFKDTLKYLSEEIRRTDNPRLWFFLLPQIRSLLDIYARFLHLQINTSNQTKEAMTCIAYQLLSCKSLNTDIEYKNSLMIYKDFLDKQPTKFPQKPEDLKWSWLEKNELIFTKRSELLTKENIITHSLYAKAVFGADKTYDIYSYLSEFLHGNPYYYRKEAGNEKFWIVTISVSTSAFLLELIDKYTLNRIQPRDFRIWLEAVKRNMSSLTLLWRARRG